MTSPDIIKLAVLAVGGQGGGVLSNWIVALAEREGWCVQSTAVAGVAQRTGATFYYVEMAPDTGRAPVFALAPSPGDVDILIAAEWMEAGRAVMRGFVTPDRTVMIASTHRMLAVAEKVVPGDGAADGEEVASALEAAAKRVIAFDMQRPAVEAGSVVSATLFGALAASGALPFPPESFEATIRAGGRGVDASLAAFRTGREGPGERAAEEPASAAGDAHEAVGPPAARAAWEALLSRLEDLPAPARPIARAGLRKVVDFQDLDYGAAYLDHLQTIAGLDDREGAALSQAAAKHIANAMAYDDVIRVADLKTRAARFRRIHGEMAAAPEQLHLTEFMHPRIEELCGTLPARLGRWIEARPRLAGWIDRRINRGRRVRTDSIRGFLSLYLVAGMRRWRRATLRHQVEQAHVAEWLDLVRRTVPADYDLAVEILNCRRLVKGYSDTHARGQSKYDKVIGALAMLDGREDAADWLRRLIEAALKDAEGQALEGALKTVASFART